VWAKYKSLADEEQKNPGLINALKQLDVNVNINWPLVHYKSAVRYLQQNTEDIAATGGTNWQKYLPPRFQKRVFYPELWTATELEDWGKGWVETHVFKIKA
jgi:tryptophan 2,3-dioxygenase